MTGFRWVRPPSELARSVADYERRVMVAVAALAQFFATKMQNEARVNAPWTDRTGNARSGLFGQVVKDAQVTRIVLGGTVFYQVFLELANGQRYAVIMPTIEANLPELERALERLFRD